MKKGLLIVVLIVGCVLLSGCSIFESKIEVLTCSKMGSSQGILYKEYQDLTFKGKKVTEYKLTLKFDLARITDKNSFNDAVDALREEYSKAIEKGVITNVYPEGYYAVAEFTMNPELFDGILDYNNYDLRDVFSSKFYLKDLKPQMEKEGYVCETR